MSVLAPPTGLLARLRPDRFTLLLAAIAVLGGALVLAREAVYGVALGWDSSNYLASARGLLSGEGFQRYVYESPYTAWAPFYPMALAAASLGAVDPQSVAGPLGAAAHAITVFIAGRWMRDHIQSRLLAAWGCLAIALSVPLTWIASFALSESLFIVFVTLALVLASRHLADGKRSSLLGAAAFTGLAWATRYMGVAAFAVVVLLLIFRRGVPLREKSGRVALYAFISAAPIGLWMTRNYLMGGFFAQRPPDIDYALSEKLIDMLGYAGGWLAGGQWPFDQGAAGWLVGGVLLAGAVAACALRRWPPREGRRSDWNPLLVFGGFALAFFALHIPGVEFTHDGVQERYLIPAYVPLVLAGVFLMDGFLARARERAARSADGERFAAGAAMARFAGAFLAVALSVWLAAAASVQASEIRRANTDGLFQSVNKIARASETARHIRENPLRGRTFNNWSNFLYLSAYTSAKYLELPRRLDHTQQELQKEEDGTHIVWFYRASSSPFRNYGADVFRGQDGLETVANLPDGVIFRVNKAHSRSRPALRAAYADAIATEPVARSVFNIRLDGGALTYAKSPCAPQDTASKFFLHIYPQDMNDLPPGHAAYGFHNADIAFGREGALFEGNCWAVVPLPEYPIRRIRTGQFGPEGELWSSSIIPVFDVASYRAQYDAVSSRVPDLSSVFDVYLDGRTLTYAKSPCAPQDVEAPFFLHIIPEDPTNLPQDRREHGYANLDFDFGWNDAVFDGRCWTSVLLPEHQIKRIVTGQFTPRGRLWTGGVTPGFSPAAFLADFDAAASGEPSAQAVFDIYLDGRTLTYTKSPCAPQDIENPFFLHVIPSDRASLPEERQEHGFENRDFAFESEGAILEGKCLASVQLPDYGVSLIRTGQWVRGGSRLWIANIRSSR